MMSSSISETLPNPAWEETLRSKYTSGVAHAFILHFNVGDVVKPGKGLRRHLATFPRDIICYYNSAAGIEFATASMKSKALAVLGYQQPASSAGGMSSAVMAALGTAGGASGDVALPRGPSQALPLLQKLLEEGDKVMVVIDYAEYLAPDSSPAMMSPEDRTNLIMLESWGRNPAIIAKGNMVILTTSNLVDLNSTLRAASSKYEAIEIPLPDTATRSAYIDYYIAKPGTAVALQMTPTALGNATAGLSLLGIEDVFLRAKQTGTLTSALVRERKDEIISTEFGDVLEVVEPRFGFAAIGGLEHVKRFFDRSVIIPAQSGNRKRMPKGVLMVGPAGVGKSAMAEAIAWECGFNFVKLNPARIFQGLVGQSERNLEKALRAIMSLTPVIVFIDEADQAFQRGGQGDSGVSSRIFRRILEFMADPGLRGKCIFLAASNRPDLMDAALRRPGRFDRKIAFLVPDAAEREAIIKIMASNYQLDTSDISVPQMVLERTEGWTGAELEALAIKALELTEDEGLGAEAALIQASERLRPSTADIKLMSELAIRETNDTDLLPPAYKRELDDRERLDRRIEEMQEVGRGEVRREL